MQQRRVVGLRNHATVVLLAPPDPVNDQQGQSNQQGNQQEKAKLEVLQGISKVMKRQLLRQA